MSAEPWDRRYAFLIGLTGAAGTLDALAFLYLGKVFSSFQSGNLLFLGLGASAGHSDRAIRAGVVLIAFFLGAAAGARIIGTRLRPSRSPRAGLGVLALEGALLAIFAGLWLVVGTPLDHPVAGFVLLGLSAVAMGMQVALALALKIPNVVTVALTATLAYLEQRAGDPGTTRDPDMPATALLVGLCATYVLCAAVIAVLPETSVLALAPLALLAFAVASESGQLGLRTAFTTPSARRSKLS